MKATENGSMSSVKNRSFRLKHFAFALCIAFTISTIFSFVWFAFIPKHEATFVVEIRDSPGSAPGKEAIRMLEAAAKLVGLESRTAEPSGRPFMPTSVSDLFDRIRDLWNPRRSFGSLYNFSVRGRSAPNLLASANAAVNSAIALGRARYQNDRDKALKRFYESATPYQLAEAKLNQGCPVVGSPYEIWDRPKTAQRLWFGGWPQDWVKILISTGILTAIFSSVIFRRRESFFTAFTRRQHVHAN